MKIGIDCRLPYYQMGGISQYILNLLPALALLDETNQFTLLHSRKEGRSYTPRPHPNFQRRNLWTPCHHRWEKWALAAELLPHQFDVLHSPDFIPPAGGARRRIITIHDLNFLYYPEFLTAESRRYYANQIRWAVQVADHISADSESTRQDLIALLNVPPDKVTTIHLSVNPLYERVYSETTVSRTLAEHNLPRGFILFVGTLEPRKNIPMLLQAYKLLREETAVTVPLVLVGGKGWLYDEIFATIDSLKLGAFVHHLSGVYDEQLAHLYHAAGVLVTPSHYEGFGLPALEALYCNCPVIVSDRGSLPEIVGEAGAVLPADSPDLWAEKMAQVLNDSAYRQQMTALGQLQAQRFSWQKAARMTLNLYMGGINNYWLG